jgi:glycogen operon protein
VLRRRRWLSGRELLESGAPDVVWLHPEGRAMRVEDWPAPWSRALGVFLNGEEIVGRSPHGERVLDTRLVILLNAWWEELGWSAPGEPLGAGWSVVLDTSEPGTPAGTRVAAGGRVRVGGRSVVVLGRT